MLDRGAAVPHDAHAGSLGALRRGDVAEVKLEPEHLHSGLPCVVHDGIEELTAAEHVDEVHMLGLWDVCEAVVGALSVDDRTAQQRVHRDDAKALVAQVARDRITRS